MAQPQLPPDPTHHELSTEKIYAIISQRVFQTAMANKKWSSLVYDDPDTLTQLSHLHTKEDWDRFEDEVLMRNVDGNLKFITTDQPELPFTLNPDYSQYGHVSPNASQKSSNRTSPSLVSCSIDSGYYDQQFWAPSSPPNTSCQQNQQYSMPLSQNGYVPVNNPTPNPQVQWCNQSGVHPNGFVQTQYTTPQYYPQFPPTQQNMSGYQNYSQGSAQYYHSNNNNGGSTITNEMARLQTIVNHGYDQRYGYNSQPTPQYAGSGPVNNFLPVQNMQNTQLINNTANYGYFNNQNPNVSSGPPYQNATQPMTQCTGAPPINHPSSHPPVQNMQNTSLVNINSTTGFSNTQPPNGHLGPENAICYPNTTQPMTQHTGAPPMNHTVNNPPVQTMQNTQPTHNCAPPGCSYIPYPNGHSIPVQNNGYPNTTQQMPPNSNTAPVCNPNNFQPVQNMQNAQPGFSNTQYQYHNSGAQQNICYPEPHQPGPSNSNQVPLPQQGFPPMVSNLPHHQNNAYNQPRRDARQKFNNGQASNQYNKNNSHHRTTSQKPFVPRQVVNQQARQSTNAGGVQRDVTQQMPQQSKPDSQSVNVAFVPRGFAPILPNTKPTNSPMRSKSVGSKPRNERTIHVHFEQQTTETTQRSTTCKPTTVPVNSAATGTQQELSTTDSLSSEVAPSACQPIVPTSDACVIDEKSPDPTPIHPVLKEIFTKVSEAVASQSSSTTEKEEVTGTPNLPLLSPTEGMKPNETPETEAEKTSESKTEKPTAIITLKPNEVNIEASTSSETHEATLTQSDWPKLIGSQQQNETNTSSPAVEANHENKDSDHLIGKADASEVNNKDTPVETALSFSDAVKKNGGTQITTNKPAATHKPFGFPKSGKIVVSTPTESNKLSKPSPVVASKKPLPKKDEWITVPQKKSSTVTIPNHPEPKKKKVSVKKDEPVLSTPTVPVEPYLDSQPDELPRKTEATPAMNQTKPTKKNKKVAPKGKNAKKSQKKEEENLDDLLSHFAKIDASNSDQTPHSKPVPKKKRTVSQVRRENEAKEKEEESQYCTVGVEMETKVKPDLSEFTLDDWAEYDKKYKGEEEKWRNAVRYGFDEFMEDLNESVINQEPLEYWPECPIFDRCEDPDTTVERREKLNIFLYNRLDLASDKKWGGNLPIVRTAFYRNLINGYTANLGPVIEPFMEMNAKGLYTSAEEMKFMLKIVNMREFKHLENTFAPAYNLT